MCIEANHFLSDDMKKVFNESVEIYVPLDWRVDLQANAFLGGCEDKRVPGVNIDQSRRLVVIGNVSFGGVEIKG